MLELAVVDHVGNRLLVHFDHPNWQESCRDQNVPVGCSRRGRGAQSRGDFCQRQGCDPPVQEFSHRQDGGIQASH